ncbi:flagellin N-terminal helical domain-containing protein [Paenibacillus doosanensis]|uniref:flagellin N-terminal helical domain-containing protein n=1 Tax=Paenibacillus doosanensis TaxID=1229154 RepID=UPI00287BBC8F|nr:flagellin [Paenibacillus doosanensis]
MKIAHNLSTLNTLNRLNKNIKTTGNTLKKLSSGLRINMASDDAAGLAISEKLRAQIRGLSQASRNVQDGISLIQTTDSALGTIQDPALIRLKELAVLAANGTLTDSDRGMIQDEVEMIKEGINTIANNTHFNGIHLLNVSRSPFDSLSNTIYTGTNVSSLPSSCLIGNSSNIHEAAGIEITAGVNDGLTVKVDGNSYSITIAAGIYNGSTTALYNDINSKLLAAGAQLELTDVYGSWDDTHMRTLLSSTVAGNHTIEVEGTAFNEIFAQEEGYKFGDHYEVWGREADFSVGYTVISGDNDTLNLKDMGIDKTIVLSAGSYSRDDLITELNKQLTNVGANITASISSTSIGVNTSPNIGNKHYILTLKHNLSSDKNAIQLVSGNALNPLFLRSANKGDTWAPLTKSYLKTNVDITNGLTIDERSNIWEFTVDGSLKKTVTITAGSYTSTTFINALNKELNTVNAGIKAVNDQGMLRFEREMNGNSYTITNLNIYGDIKSGASLNLQVGANSGDTFEFDLTDVRTAALGIDNIDLSTRQDAESTFVKIDRALKTVSQERSRFGAYQNRLEHIQNNLLNYESNLASAESRIRDVDMAREMIEFSKNNILSQAAEAMLAQANLEPQTVLQLIKSN